MRVVRLRAENFRRFERLSLPITGRLNLFVGDNAAGKTTLLEMLYCLGRGRSFRGNALQELVGPLQRQWTVFAQLEGEDGAARTCGVQWNPEGLVLRENGAEARIVDLLRLIPIQILEPSMHRLVLEGPSYRRSFLDWGVFHVEHRFLDAWRRYRRALRQRNQLLRLRRGAAEIAAWEPELAESGEVLHALRQAHLRSIEPRLLPRMQSLTEEGDWSFELYPGWSAELGLAEALARGRARDLELGATAQGPHRAELKIRSSARAVRNRISRGQQKLLLAAMLLAQSEEIARITGLAPILLIDDLNAELAPRYEQRLVAELRAYVGQVFITAFAPIEGLQDAATVFHVEHGTVRI